VAEPLTPDEVKKIRNDYNFILNLASKDQTGSVRKFWNDLRKVIRNSDGDTTIITAYVNREFPKVEYFKNLYGAQAEAEIQGARPELAADVNRAVDVKRQAVNAAIEKYGIELPEGQLDILAREAWRNNWGVTEIDLNLRPFLADTLETGEDLRGTAGDFQNDLSQWASRNGLSIDRSMLAKYVGNMTLGQQTLDDVKQELRTTYLMGAYPAWADRIEKGFDPEAISRPYRSAAAKLLEVNEDEISLDDPLLKRGLQGTGADGKPRVVPLYEFESEIRKDPRWDKTNNAYETYTKVGTDLLRMFGLR
jgi:hypothetical protein